MFSFSLRRFLIGPILRTLLLPLGWSNGETGLVGGSEYLTEPTNARLWLARVREIRRDEVKLMAERLGIDRVHLCLLGAEVRIEQAPEGQRLLQPSRAVIGTLNSLGDSSRLVVCDGSGLAGPAYVIGD